MNYVNALLAPDETVRFETRRHWLVYRHAIVMLALFVASLALPQDLHGEKFIIAIFLVPLAGIAALFGWIRRAATVIAVTNHRLICKKGLIARHTVEMNLDKVESVDVDQTVLGRIFGFGTVTIRGVGTTIDPIRGIADPIGLRQAVFASP
ncbi:MAG: PH domain-containing protein [Beijerinckiaceae bacterium]|jgi:uncharacterized membrane protein YdbT with pleckstrin-like domain